MINIKASFSQEKGEFMTEKGISHELYKDAGPYDYLIGALSGCLYKTFADIAQKMRVTYDSITMNIQGEKRTETPTTLSTCHLEIKAYGASDQEKLKNAFEKATRYCSIYYTLSQVAKMTWSISF
ncbi:MAG: OsmC family protein [Sphaerochaetaceae bacterium]|jgi:putative redox protein|nr:OsmC family protein [Sphaerochaetaceae bacterium]